VRASALYLLRVCVGLPFFLCRVFFAYEFRWLWGCGK